MKVVTRIDPERREMPCVLALGMFDGVHVGHRELMDAAVREAGIRGVNAAALTFDRTPAQALFPERHVHLLTTLPERARRMAICGLDRMYMLPFDRKTAAIPADTFIQWMVETLRPVCVVAGYDYTFGRGGLGNTEMLKERLGDLGIDVIVVSAVHMEGAPVSSTRIRKALQDGAIHEANAMLGYDYSLSGTVVEGKHLGTELGFPTANIHVSGKKQLPAYGVYTCLMETGDEVLKAVVNIGEQPTVPSGRVTVEAFILSGIHEIRGRAVRITLKDFLRPEVKFRSLDELKNQIRMDAEEAGKRLGESRKA